MEGSLVVVTACRTFFYLVQIVMSLVIFIPVSISMYKCRGECLLFSKKTGVGYFTYGDQSNCVYAVASSIIFNFVIGSIYIIIGIVSLCGNRDLVVNVASRNYRLSLLMDGLCFVFMMACAGVITHGLQITCENLAGNMRNCENSYITDRNGRNYYFYDHLSVAMTSAWISVVLWLIQLVIALAAVVCLAQVITVQMKGQKK